MSKHAMLIVRIGLLYRAYGLGYHDKRANISLEQNLMDHLMTKKWLKFQHWMQGTCPPPQVGNSGGCPPKKNQFLKEIFGICAETFGFSDIYVVS